MSPSIVAGYAADPLIDGLLALSGRQEPSKPLPFRPATGDLRAKIGIAFVMVNRELASPELLEYVELQMPLTLIASEGERAAVWRSTVRGDGQGAWRHITLLDR